MKSQREQYALILESIDDEIPLACRVRWLLKHAKRVLKLRCVRVVDPSLVDVKDFMSQPDEVSSSTKNQQV